MQSNQWWNYVLIGGVLAAIVVSVILVRRTRIRGSDQGGASNILDRGWQYYFTPTSLDPPGTVFRIDAQGRRYSVGTIQLQPQVGEEAFGVHTRAVEANLGIFARFLGLKDTNLRVGAAKAEQLVFKLEKPEREYLEDQALDKVLPPFLKELGYRVDNRYFIIRECRKALGITHHLTRSQVDDLGGEASLSGQLGLKGTLFKGEKSDEFRLDQKFDKPLRVMFLPEEIKPVRASLAGEEPELGRVPVTKPLVWKEG